MVGETENQLVAADSYLLAVLVLMLVEFREKQSLGFLNRGVESNPAFIISMYETIPVDS